jgi:hypothetical protein
MTRSIRLDGPVLIEVAYSPSSEGARAGLFRSNSGRVSLDFMYARPKEENKGIRTRGGLFSGGV